MDPRDRADAMLARARARRAYIVTPEDATSPMDAANTQQIPRSTIEAADHRGESEEVTRSMPGPGARGTTPPPQQPRQQPPTPPAWPVVEERDTDTDRVEPPTGPIPALAAETVTTSVWPLNPQDSGRHPPVTDPREQQPWPRQVDGMLPTIQQPPTRRRSLTQRLDGEHD